MPRTTRTARGRWRPRCGASFDFDEWGVVLGVLADKDAAGIVAELAPLAAHVFATAPDSERADDADRIADLAEAHGLPVTVHADVAEAAEAARAWAAASDRRAVVDRRVGRAGRRSGEPGRPQRTGRPGGASDRAGGRRTQTASPRGAAESLGSIVLAFESIIVFLGGLAVYGLKALPEPIPPWWGIVGGCGAGGRDAADRPRCCATAGASSSAGCCRCIVALGGFLVPALFLVALIFGGMWAYATIKGASLDARNARLAAEADTANGD